MTLDQYALLPLFLQAVVAGAGVRLGWAAIGSIAERLGRRIIR